MAGQPADFSRSSWPRMERKCPICAALCFVVALFHCVSRQGAIALQTTPRSRRCPTRRAASSAPPSAASSARARRESLLPGDVLCRTERPPAACGGGLAAATLFASPPTSEDGGALGDDATGDDDGATSSGPPRRSNKSLGRLAASRARWYNRLEELRSFADENGHCAVPPSHPGGLAGWVAAQRSNHAKWREGRPSPLTDDRREALDVLEGFEWDVNNALWRTNLEELRRYREERGDANVPHSGGSLGRWVHLQRLEYHRWKRARGEAGGEEYVGGMTEERAALLEEAGMEWDPRQRQFDEMASALRRFKELTGHINVGAREGRLSAWFYRQRRAYKDMLEGKVSSAMTEERRAALEELGFRPDMFNNRTSSTAFPAKKQKKKKTPKIKVSWEDNFDNLRDYQDRNGHCNVPQLEGKLGRFVRHQRQLMMERQKLGAQTTLTEERIEKLESIGFIWDLNEFRWNEKLEQLREYAEDNGGDCNVPQSYGELGDWCETQREQYVLKRKGTSTFLTDEREEALTELGFTWRRGEQVKSRREAAWNRNLDRLRDYREEHGHCRVPRSHELANWVKSQRTAYRSLLRGEKSSITGERRAKLEAIGFE